MGVLFTPLLPLILVSEACTLVIRMYQNSDGLHSVPRHLQGLSTDELLEYQSLSSHCVRLRQLLILQEAKEEHHANEVRQRDAILEIRSRRRAWQNKALVARVGDMNVGLATPYASSRLAQVSWSGEDYEYVPPSYDSTAEEEYVEEYEEYDEKLGWD